MSSTVAQPLSAGHFMWRQDSQSYATPLSPRTSPSARGSPKLAPTSAAAAIAERAIILNNSMSVVEGGNVVVVAADSRGSSISVPRNSLSLRKSDVRPSRKLISLVENIAFFRRVPPPAVIHPEVVLAFDGYLSRGVTLKKFVPCGPPHDRFFSFQFLDLQHSAAAAPLAAGVPMPECVLGWYRNAESRRMRRFLPLHDLDAVIAGGAGHPLVERRRASPKHDEAATSQRQHGEGGLRTTVVPEGQNHGVLRGARTHMRRQYMAGTYIVQLRFVSAVSRGEETLALMTNNATVYLALRVVGDFLSRIGKDL